MAKIYSNKATNIVTISGVVDSINDDRMQFSVKSEAFNNERKKEEKIVNVAMMENPLDPSISVGSGITVAAYLNGRTKLYEAESVIGKNGSFDKDDLCIIRGNVMFAGYNEEKNADGTPRMAKEYEGKPAHAKKPHFDFGIATEEPDPASSNNETRRVLHTIRVYPMTRNGEVDEKNLTTVKKLFGNYDKNKSLATVTVVTLPGQEYTREEEVNGRIYKNTYVNHLGYKSLDVEFTEVKEKTNEAPKKAPAKEAAKAKEDEVPAQVAEGSGFDNPVISEEQEIDTDTIFI